MFKRKKNYHQEPDTKPCKKCAHYKTDYSDCEFCYVTNSFRPFERKKKKTGCETPELRKLTPPPPIPPLPVTELPSRHPRTVAKFAVDTEDKLDVLVAKYPDAIKIEGATIYWSDNQMALFLVAPQEWKDCLFGGKELPRTERKKIND